MLSIKLIPTKPAVTASENNLAWFSDDAPYEIVEESLDNLSSAITKCLF